MTACDAKDKVLTSLARKAVAGGDIRMRAAAAIAGSDQLADLDGTLLNAATAVELVQLGAITHDDVIGAVENRMGVSTVNSQSGNLQAILAGDFLMARASELAAAHGTEVARLLAETIGWICEGRARQIAQSGDARPTPEDRLTTLDTPNRSAVRDGCRHRCDGRRGDCL